MRPLLEKTVFVHLLPKSVYSDKFVNTILSEENNPDIKHLCFTLGDISICKPWVKGIPKAKGPKFLKALKAIFWIKKEIKSYNVQKIYIHYLSFPFMVLVLASGLIRRSSWVLWGGDLYDNQNCLQRNLKERLSFILEKLFLKRIYSICSLLPGDYNLARGKYDISPIYENVFYPNPVDFDLLDKVREIGNGVTKNRILLGNSATSTNNHMDFFRKAQGSALQGENIEIHCPLSYGDLDYGIRVAEKGKEVFPRFNPLFEFMDEKKYARFLNSIGVAVMNHNRQQGLGNIVALIFLGKKVYLRKDGSIFPFLSGLGIKLFDVENIYSQTANEIFLFEHEIQENNRKIILMKFSEKECIRLWRDSFLRIPR